jgi:putative transposase
MWRWSSAQAHLAGADDGIVITRAVLDRVHNFSACLGDDEDEAATSAIRHTASIGRPLMEGAAVRELERKLDMTIVPRKRDPKPKSSTASQ